MFGVPGGYVTRYRGVLNGCWRGHNLETNYKNALTLNLLIFNCLSGYPPGAVLTANLNTGVGCCLGSCSLIRPSLCLVLK